MATNLERIEELERRLNRVLDTNGNLRPDRVAKPSGAMGGEKAIWDPIVGLKAEQEPSS